MREIKSLDAAGRILSWTLVRFTLVHENKTGLDFKSILRLLLNSPEKQCTFIACGEVDAPTALFPLVKHCRLHSLGQVTLKIGHC